MCSSSFCFSSKFQGVSKVFSSSYVPRSRLSPPSAKLNVMLSYWMIRSLGICPSELTLRLHTVTLFIIFSFWQVKTLQLLLKTILSPIMGLSHLTVIYRPVLRFSKLEVTEPATPSSPNKSFGTLLQYSSLPTPDLFPTQTVKSVISRFTTKKVRLLTATESLIVNSYVRTSGFYKSPKRGLMSQTSDCSAGLYGDSSMKVKFCHLCRFSPSSIMVPSYLKSTITSEKLNLK